MSKLSHCLGGYGDRQNQPTYGLIEPIQSVVSYRLTVGGTVFIVPTEVLDKWKSFVQETYRSGESCFMEFERTLTKSEKKLIKTI